MAERWNIKMLAEIILPAYEFMGNKRIASTADMKGVKMRIAGLNAKALQKFGAVPTMVTAPEGYTALERGTIDSFGFPYSYSFGAYKLYEVSKYVTDGMAMSGFICFHGISLTAWNKLPDNLKAKLPQAQALSREAMLKAYKAGDEKWIPIFKQKLEIVPFPASERAKLVAASNDIWEAWVKEQEGAGRPGREMLNFVKGEVGKLH
jgi:TRAP-type mannitol/chloroaromatic compound transport system substrate-binding protein